jgi:hypothetical protein
VGGIVPLILGIYLYLQDAISYLYIVMRANRATVLVGVCGCEWGRFVGRLGVGLGIGWGLLLVWLLWFVGLLWLLGLLGRVG